MAYQNGNFKISNSSYFCLFSHGGIALSILYGTFLKDLPMSSIIFYSLIFGLPYSIFILIYMAWCEANFPSEIVFNLVQAGVLSPVMIGASIYAFIFKDLLIAELWIGFTLLMLFFTVLVFPALTIAYYNGSDKITDFFMKK